MYGNPYVTYIERRYIEKCQKNGNSADIKSDWESKKLLYREMTKTTIYEFMNYSLHDESHSIHILESIEMVLGRKRIDKLSRSDLWLLLNSAYAHDIGMVTEYKKLEELWSDQEFRKYLKETKESLNKEDAAAARLYGLINDFLAQNAGSATASSASGINFKMHDAWPLEFRKDITLLMSNFIRDSHGELTRKFFENPEKTNNYIVEDRLYKLIGKIASCHTQKQNSVEELPRRCKGFGTDWMHPRFIAMLLRLGDLLDLDNNRFDIFSMKHFGQLPEISVAHYKRHKSITHFHIEPRVIEITAQSDDFEVCKLNQIWFQYLRDDIKYLITHWSIVAPKKLKGCLLGMPKLEVLHGNSRFTEDSITRFVLEKRKLLKLFTGNNLYSNDLAFIREYMQNAFDASRIQLFYELLPIEKDSHKTNLPSQAEVYLQNSGVDLKKLKPFDLKSTAFESFSIVITIKPDLEDCGKFILQITDRGIGIDKEGIEAIVNVGSGWERRSNHKRAINEMRGWMRPTGGFGIGLQSAYLITDEARLYTKSSFEEGRCIILSEYSNEKNVLVEIDGENLYRGTTAQFRIDFKKMQQKSIIEQFFKKELDDFDVFSQKGKLEIVYHIIADYVRQTFPMSLFPIKMQLLNAEGNEEIACNTVVNSYLCIEEQVYGDKKKREVPIFHNCGKQSLEGQKLSPVGQVVADFVRMEHDTPEDVYFYLCEGKMYVWDDGPQILYCFSVPMGRESVNILANYKNVLVQDNTRHVLLGNTKHAEFVEIAYDVMGIVVKDCLVVSRNKFREDALAQKNIRIDFFTRMYAHLLLNMAVNSGMNIPGSILLSSCLIEADEELVKKVIAGCCSILENQVYTSWYFELNENRWEINKRIISADRILKMMETTILMAEIPDPEERSSQLEYRCNPSDGEDGVHLYPKNGSIAHKELILDKDAVIIGDKKIYAVLSRYRKKKTEIFVDFYDTMTKQPMKAYIINDNLNKVIPVLQKYPDSSKIVSQKSVNNEGVFKRRYIAVNLADDDALAPLMVSRVPFGAGDSNIYIITPYTLETGMRIENMLYDEQFLKRTEQMIRIIEADASYSELCQWVYDNQVDKEKKHSISKIKEAYRELIRQDLRERNGGVAFFNSKEI